MHEVIRAGEGQDLTPLENMHIRIKYPEVGQWYESLDEAGKREGGSILASE